MVLRRQSSQHYYVKHWKDWNIFINMDTYIGMSRQVVTGHITFIFYDQKLIHYHGGAVTVFIVIATLISVELWKFRPQSVIGSTGYGFTPNSSSPFLSCLDFFRFSLLVIPSEISCSSLRGFTMASGILVLCSFADKILPLGWHHFQNHLVALYSRLFLNTLLKNQVLLFGTFT